MAVGSATRGVSLARRWGFSKKTHRGGAKYANGAQRVQSLSSAPPLRLRGESALKVQQSGSACAAVLEKQGRGC